MIVTCAWLWDLAIELAQQKRNRDEFDQDVKLKPAVRGTGKEAATSALPAETEKEKKKNKKGLPPLTDREAHWAASTGPQ